MAVQIPTITELYNSILNDLNTELEITIPGFGKNILRAIASVQAAKLKLYYYFTAGVQRNVFPDQADPESQGGTLERFGRVKLGRNPFPAVAAVYVVNVTGAAGATIKASTTFKSDDDSDNPGKLFILDTEYTLTGSGDTITLRALEGGTDSELSLGNTLTSTAPLLNVEDVVAVNSVTTTPVDAESVEDYRRKTLEAYRLEPQGGAASDYRLWASDAVGVRTVYPYAVTATNNTIDVYVESETPPGTAPPDMLAEVAAVIEQDPDTTKPDNERGRRPLGILQVNTKSVILLDVDITIAGLAVDNSEVQGVIENALTAYLNTVRPFIPGADSLVFKNDVLTVGKLSLIVQDAIGLGNYFNTLSFSVDGNPITSLFTFDNGNIPTLTSITYTA